MNNLSPNVPEDLSSFEKCRNIHKEIVDFGVNQKETIKLIELLAMELEDIVLMKKIINTIKEETLKEKENLQNNNLII